ncbi:unnamed protein product [Paramecium primaurelia]|uniref:Uncharacterized protein n=2 Tax=Paramecium TaxID=5884 RepID=A0A8S1S060_9CILI|nr:unnamed protein product [Paramecium primaurelia]CAD8133626.1 unnamed protein product [Paramecium pentaurelia]
MQKFSTVRQQLQPLFPIDQNTTVKFKPRSSSYCERIKQLQQRTVSQMPKCRKSIIFCMGETSRLNSFLIKSKPKYVSKTNTRHQTLQNENSINYDISPWENYSPT